MSIKVAKLLLPSFRSFVCPKFRDVKELKMFFSLSIRIYSYSKIIKKSTDLSSYYFKNMYHENCIKVQKHSSKKRNIKKWSKHARPTCLTLGASASPWTGTPPFTVARKERFPDPEGKVPGSRKNGSQKDYVINYSINQSIHQELTQ